jgi:serine O-acetyltransferase
MTTESASAPDPVWQRLRNEAEQAANHEPVLAELIQTTILYNPSLESALAHRISRKLGHHAIAEPRLQDLFEDILAQHTYIGQQARRDIVAIDQRDPASNGFLAPVLYYKGFLALTAHRVAHELWNHGRRQIALYLQSINSQIFAVDIHPAARIGAGVLLDHATSIVIGETAVVEDNVSLLHEVTLGGTGKTRGDRHPKVRSGVLIGAGAKILGNVSIGEGSKVGAGSVVLQDVPPHVTVAGIPARVCGSAEKDPAAAMNHSI